MTFRYITSAPVSASPGPPTPPAKRLFAGGFGLYYTRPNGNATLQVLTSPPFVGIRQLSGPNNSAATFQTPYNPAPQAGSFLARTPTSNLAADIIAPNYDSPATEQYNLNVQQQLSGSTALELAYVGTRGSRLLESREINEPILASTTSPVNGITTNTPDNAASRVPYSGFSPTGLTQIESYGFSMYNSLQATIRHQLSHGVLLSAAYTWEQGDDRRAGLRHKCRLHGRRWRQQRPQRSPSTLGTCRL